MATKKVIEKVEEVEIPKVKAPRKPRAVKVLPPVVEEAPKVKKPRAPRKPKVEVKVIPEITQEVKKLATKEEITQSIEKVISSLGSEMTKNKPSSFKSTAIEIAIVTAIEIAIVISILVGAYFAGAWINSSVSCFYEENKTIESCEINTTNPTK